MDIKLEIKNLENKIRMQHEYLSDIEKTKDFQANSKIDPDETTRILMNELKENENELKKLYWKYDQYMISRMVKGGIEDDEMGAWWRNRY